jgi:hypothetical protein
LGVSEGRNPRVRKTPRGPALKARWGQRHGTKVPPLRNEEDPRTQAGVPVLRGDANFGWVGIFLLFGAQGYGWVYAGGALCWDVGGGQGDGDQDGDNGGEGCEVVGFGVEE